MSNTPNEPSNLPNQTPAELRAFLRSLISDANDALAHLAEGEYEKAREDVRCLDVDAAHIVSGIERLDEENPRCRCSSGACVDCQGIVAAEWA